MPVKISNTTISNTSSSGVKSSQTTNSASGVGGSDSFQSVFKTARLDNFNGTMKELLDIVRTRGTEFIHSPQEESLNSYRESVKLFLNRIKDEFLSLKEEFGASRDGEQRLYQLVETAGGQADSMTKEAFTQDKAVDLLASLDDIRGLVLDVIG
jgi:uncharacterized protein YaaR (DUF327 family)